MCASINSYQLTGRGLSWTDYCISIHRLYVLPERIHSRSRTALVKTHTYTRIKTKRVQAANIKCASIFLIASSADAAHHSLTRWRKLGTYIVDILLSGIASMLFQMLSESC